jgi:hypothetical protein
VDLGTAAFFAGNVAEAVVVGLLIHKRVWRTLPFFCIYSIECLAGSILYYVVQVNCSPRTAFNTFFYETILDSALQFCVLVEVAWSVFRPYRKSLPRGTVLILGLLIAAAAGVIWPFANSSASLLTNRQGHLLLHLQQTVSILRVFFFLVLAGCSQLLSIGWKDRELQVATGLGFYSLVSLSVTVWHSHQTSGQQYVALEGLLAATYLCSLLYWVFSFVQKEAERREFSPQMQSMLLAVAGAARTTRVALAESRTTPPRTDGRR